MRLALLNLAPQPFEIVELTLFRREDVDDGIAQIEQDPAAIGMALDALDGVAVGLRGLDDRVDDRTRLNLRTAGDDCERVGKNRAAGYVDGNEVFALFFERGVTNDVD